MKEKVVRLAKALETSLAQRQINHKVLLQQQDQITEGQRQISMLEINTHDLIDNNHILIKNGSLTAFSQISNPDKKRFEALQNIIREKDI